MNVLNFSHPLTQTQIAQIEATLGRSVSRVQDVRVQFTLEQEFKPQVTALLDELGIAPVRWQTEVWLMVLPSLNYITAILLAELHGRMGRFPVMLRLRPVSDALVTEYELAEVVDLEQVRAETRTRR